MIARRGRLGPLNRTAALLLALIWFAAGLFALIIGFARGLWLPVVCGVFACGYGILWSRVAARSRLLGWKDLAVPWRGGARSARRRRSLRAPRP